MKKVMGQPAEKRRRVRGVLWGMIFLGVAASLYSAGRRWQAETRNRAVEIVLDFAEVRTIAAAEGKSIGDTLRRFQKAGVVSVAVQEDTIAGLVEQRRIEIFPGRDTDFVNLSVMGPETVKRALAALKAKLPAKIEADTSDPSSAFLQIAAPLNAVRIVGVGMEPHAVALVKGAGLGVVGRVFNFSGTTPANIAWTLQNLKDSGAHSVLFAGDDALGFKAHLLEDPEKLEQASTATLIKNLGLTVGIVEFSKQKGTDTLAKPDADNAVRVHTLSGAEMTNAEIPATIQRYLLAARERNIRQLFVHLFLNESPLLETNAKMIEDIATGLDRGNLIRVRAHGYAPLSTPLYVRLLIGIGIAAAWLLLVESVVGGLQNLGGIYVAGIGFIALILVALPCVPILLGAKLAALAAACLYPSLALLYTDHLRPPHKAGSPVGVAFLRFFAISAITACGVAAIVGLLADRLFLLKADAFLGIKGAQIVPIVAAFLVVALNLRADEHRTFKEAALQLWNRLTDFVAQPIRYWQVIALALAFGVILLLIDRSGNDSSVGVSVFELKTRAILDRLLYARPRFKEFVIGHPALILALIFAAQGRRQWAIPLFLIGAIGQVSLLNTFCHLHTPLLVSLWRAALGLGIGVLIGLTGYGVWRWALGIERRV